MTEWWVSQAKNWCKICRVWTGGHRQQIIKHETGRAHIENEAKGIKDCRERAKEKEKEEKSVLDQLAEIERKAAAAMAAEALPPPPRAGSAVQQPAATSGAAIMDARLEQEAHKRRIEEVIAAAKKRKIDPHAAAWTKHTDPNSKVVYYYNTVTTESSWERPAGFVEPVAGAEAAVAARQDGPSAAGSPWMACTDPNSGCQYYYNSVTKESSWERPADFDSAAAAAIAEVGASASSVGAAAAAQAAAAVSQPTHCVTAPVAAAVAAPAAVATTPASPSAVGPAPAAGSPWVVCTDPTSGHVYYFNQVTKTSSWDVPADLGVDLSKPPPPPSSNPPPPPARSGTSAAAAGAAAVGGWREVQPEESAWKPSENAQERDSDEEPALDPVIAMKYLTMRRGAWMDEDYERHEKEMEPITCSTHSTGKTQSFPLNRKKASGIRKNREDDDARCV